MQRSFTSGSRPAPDKYDQFLENHNFFRKHTARDGSSLFRVISEQMYDTQKHHYDIRMNCVRFMRRNRKYFEHLVGNIDFNDYLFELTQPTTFGTLIELRAVSHMFRRNVLVFYPLELGEVLVHCDSYTKFFRVFYAHEYHFDSIFTIDYIRDAAACQSICYEMLYKSLFKLPDVAYAVEKMLHPGTFEWGVCKTQYNEFGYLLWLTIEDGRTFQFDLPLNTKCILENYKLCHYHNANFYDDVQKEKKWFALNNQPRLDYNKATFEESLLQEKYISCVRQLLDDGITPFPYKVAKALDPHMYRNVEFDSWNDIRKESKFQQWYNGDSNFKVGAKCHVKLKNSEQDLYTCHIQEIAADKRCCVVFVEQLGEKHMVPYDTLTPLPVDQFKPWALPYRLQRQFQKYGSLKLTQKYKMKFNNNYIGNNNNNNTKYNGKYLDDFYEPITPIFPSKSSWKQHLIHYEHFRAPIMDYYTLPVHVNYNQQLNGYEVTNTGNDELTAVGDCMNNNNCADVVGGGGAAGDGAGGVGVGEQQSTTTVMTELETAAPLTSTNELNTNSDNVAPLDCDHQPNVEAIVMDGSQPPFQPACVINFIDGGEACGGGSAAFFNGPPSYNSFDMLGNGVRIYVADGVDYIANGGGGGGAAAAAAATYFPPSGLPQPYPIDEYYAGAAYNGAIVPTDINGTCYYMPAGFAAMPPSYNGNPGVPIMTHAFGNARMPPTQTPIIGPQAHQTQPSSYPPSYPPPPLPPHYYQAGHGMSPLPDGQLPVYYPPNMAAFHAATSPSNGIYNAPATALLAPLSHHQHPTHTQNEAYDTTCNYTPPVQSRSGSANARCCVGATGNSGAATGLPCSDTKYAKSFRAGGEDLPSDLQMLRYFYNLGVEYHNKIISRRSRSSRTDASHDNNHQSNNNNNNSHHNSRWDRYSNSASSNNFNLNRNVWHGSHAQHNAENGQNNNNIPINTSNNVNADLQAMHIDDNNASSGKESNTEGNANVARNVRRSPNGGNSYGSANTRPPTPPARTYPTRSFENRNINNGNNNNNNSNSMRDNNGPRREPQNLSAHSAATHGTGFIHSAGAVIEQQHLQIGVDMNMHTDIIEPTHTQQMSTATITPTTTITTGKHPHSNTTNINHKNNNNNNKINHNNNNIDGYTVNNAATPPPPPNTPKSTNTQAPITTTTMSAVTGMTTPNNSNGNGGINGGIFMSMHPPPYSIYTSLPPPSGPPPPPPSAIPNGVIYSTTTTTAAATPIQAPPRQSVQIGSKQTAILPPASSAANIAPVSMQQPPLPPMNNCYFTNAKITLDANENVIATDFGGTGAGGGGMHAAGVAATAPYACLSYPPPPQPLSFFYTPKTNIPISPHRSQPPLTSPGPPIISPQGGYWLQSIQANTNARHVPTRPQQGLQQQQQQQQQQQTQE